MNVQQKPYAPLNVEMEAESWQPLHYFAVFTMQGERP